MKNKIAIYFAGSIKKEHEKNNEFYWSESDMEFLQTNLTAYEISFLNPTFRTDDLSDQHSVFGRDMLQVFCSDIIFVNAREMRGLGVGAGMIWAKIHKLPIITLAPKNSHYHKSTTTLLDVTVKNWVHPFVESLSDAIVENLNEGAMWIERFLSNSSIPIKDSAYIESAMQHYCATQFQSDVPMKKLLSDSPELERRVVQFDVKNLTKVNYVNNQT